MVMKAYIILLFTLFLMPFNQWSSSFALQSQQSFYKAKGKASYYADKFNGRKTSSGEKFCNDSLTAAHKYLPFGTFVIVKNLRNDSVVVVKINDRLPMKSSRIIDLSKAAARKLNFINSGLTQVYIEELIEY
jgi:rare lipoprotein A